MVSASLLLAAAVANLGAAPVDTLSRATPVDRCGFDQLRETLTAQPQWHNLTAAAHSNPTLARDIATSMPDFRFAFVHGKSLGLLLIGGERLGDGPPGPPPVDYWQDAAAKTRASCADSGVECDVAALADAPGGLQATTLIDAADGAYRRETVAFIAGDRCSYSLQFAGPDAALSEEGWGAVRATMVELRGLVGPGR